MPRVNITIEDAEMAEEMAMSVQDTLMDQRQRTFYRAYPWLKHRLETLDALLHPGSKAQPCTSVTLAGLPLQDARSLLTDLQQHLARCYDPQEHQAFRRWQKAAKRKEEAHE